ncbi:TonB-dependent receptor [Sphingomonas sp. dw_22]|uniref:TonB-dependent receptor n=1 Tax=Sphingomonas sp. dw_22 TaxID=2721175 RepID=UPI0021171F6A|nr:TonB-dependent receptor [Sphingomonas sp. dw_22]
MRKISWAIGVSTVALLAAAGNVAHAQEAQQGAQDSAGAVPDQAEGTEIVVTGFRASLNSALNQKRSENAAIDSIVAEDIGKFPDSNLAESMQRVPGVALQRSDGGEGRQISVRGLGPQFSRVRLNGMEGASRGSSSDVFGSGLTGRSFDFNAFPTELFSQLTVRKTGSAEIEEGSLGATVDLMAPKPLDQKQDFVFTATARGVYNQVSEDVTPRGSLLVSKKFGDGRFGVLGSVAYSKRHLREVGYQSGDIISTDTNGLFCAPLGYAPIYPAIDPVRGTSATDCSTGNPRTSNVDAYEAILAARRADAPNTPGSGAFLPRTPRYFSSDSHQERVGGSFTLQFQPDENTDISLDLLYSRFDVTRDDKFIEGISFARSASNNGQPMSSIRQIELTSLGGLQYGLWDGVDVRSEGLRDSYYSTLKQGSLNLSHQFDDRLGVTIVFGRNESKYVDKQRMQYQMDAIDTDNFSIDMRGDAPRVDFGFDISDPNNFRYAPGLSDGTVFGGFSLGSKPSYTTQIGTLGQFDFNYKFSDQFSFKFGGQFRENDYKTVNTGYASADLSTKALPAGTSLASITEQVTGLDRLYGNGAPASWASIDPEKFVQAFGLDKLATCGIECGIGPSRVREDILGGYGQAAFDFTDGVGFGLRGDIGVRYVHTEQFSSGYISVAAPAGVTSPTGVVGQYNSAHRDYDDWLPSANIVIEPVKDLVLRFAAAKTLARPDLSQLVPTSTVNAVIRNGNVNNPLLDPIRANTLDAAVEWYFRPGSLLSAGFFYKDIKTFIQNITSLVPFNQLGLPDALLAGSQTAPTELFNVTQPLNTKGGKLKGIELNAQLPFTFLPGALANFGVLGNYTHVVSKITYILASANGVPTVTTTASLVNLSKNTASGTVYYEDKLFSIRGTINYRDPYMRQIPASPGSDSFGTNAQTFVDASASFNVTDNIKLIVEGQNLTDERISLYIDGNRKDQQLLSRVGRTLTAGVNVRF